MLCVGYNELRFCVVQDELAPGMGKGGIQGHIELACLQRAHDGANDRRVVLHKHRDGGIFITAGRQHRMRRLVGHPIEITIGKTMPSGFDRRPIRELPHDLSKPLRDRLFYLVLGKLDERAGAVKTFRPNRIV